jgi:hypothetical protein
MSEGVGKYVSEIAWISPIFVNFVHIKQGTHNNETTMGIVRSLDNSLF